VLWLSLTLGLCEALVRGLSCVQQSVPAAVETAASVQTFLFRRRRTIRDSSQIKARCPQAICTSHSIIQRTAIII